MIRSITWSSVKHGHQVHYESNPASRLSYRHISYGIGSKSRIRKLCDSISDLTCRRNTLLDTEDVVDCLNRRLRGWANYFKLGLASKAYRAVDRHVTTRLRRWLCKKHKQPGTGYTRYPNEYLYQELDLVRLPSLTRSFPRANA